MSEANKSRISMIGLLLTAVIWGLGYSGVQDAIDHGWSSLGIMMFRGLVAGGLCLALSFKEKWWKNKKFVISSIISGVITFAGYIVQTEGQKMTTIPQCAFFTALNVVMVPFFASIFFKTKIAKQCIFATFISLAGIFILSYDGSAISFGLGDLLNFLGALCFAIQISWMGTLSKYNSPFALAGIQLSIMGLLGAGSMLFVPSIQHVGNGGWLGMFYVAIVSSFVAFLIQAMAQKHVNAATTAILIGQEATFGTLFSVIIYHSPITWQLIIGGIFVIASVVLSSVRFNFKHKNRNFIKVREKSVNSKVTNSKDIAKYFDSIASGYNKNNMKILEKCGTIIDSINIKENSLILDIACGSGILEPFLLSKEPSLIDAVDFSKEMIDIAKTKLQDAKVKYINSDFYSFNMETKYDVAICFNSYPHFIAKQVFADNVAKLVRPGGKFFIIHSDPKEKINAVHKNIKEKKIFFDLQSADEEAKNFIDYFVINKTIDNDDYYLIEMTRK